MPTQAVRIAGGATVACARGVLADTAAPTLLLDLVERQHLAADYLSAVMDAISQLGATDDDGTSLIN